MTLRRWLYTDNKAIEELEKKCFKDPWNYRMLSDSFLNENFIGFVLEEKGEVLGYIGATLCLDECEILLVAVDESVRKKGFGTKLLTALEDAILKADAKKIFLEVRKSNVPARKCYEAFGFVTIAVRKGYYGDNEDALIMEKTIK